MKRGREPVCKVERCGGAATGFVLRGELFVGPPTEALQVGLCAFHMTEVMEMGPRSQVLAGLAAAYPSVR